MSRRTSARLALGALAAAVAVAPLTLAPPAHAGQVGVTIGIQGSGYVRVVEGSLEDDGSTVCDKTTGNLDDRVVSYCDRLRNEEPFEAWVWLRPELGMMRPGWVFAGWEGCDETRQKDGVTECAVHSGAFNSVDRTPVAKFDDQTAPVATQQSPKQTGAGAFEFSWGLNEAGATSRCVVDGVTVDPCQSPLTRTFGLGDHLFSVQAVDASGNVGLSSSMSVSVVDSALSAPPSRTNQTSLDLTLTLLGGATGVTCALDNRPHPCAAGTVRLTGLSQGTHSFYAQANKGSWEEWGGALVQWMVDLTPPETTFLPGPPPAGDRAQFAWSSSDDTARSECRLITATGTGDWMTCTSGTIWVGLQPGPHRLEVRAVDSAGNVEPAPAVQEWTVAGPVDPGPVDPKPGDRTAPTTLLGGGPLPGAISLDPVTFAVAASEAATFECSLDGQARPCSAGALALGTLAPGSHVLTVRAKDAAGNVDPHGVTRTWTVPTPAAALRGRGWKAKAVARAYAGRVLQATRRGATVSHRVAGATRLGLVVSTGKRHGVLKVYAGKRLLRTVRLAGRPATRSLVEIPLAAPYSGPVRVVVASSGRQVRLEGIAAVTR